jgi:hypothetical protein
VRFIITTSGKEKLEQTSDRLKPEEFEEFKKKNPDVEAIRQAFIANDSTILFIAVIKKRLHKIYYFTKKNPTQPIIKEIEGTTTLSTINDLLGDIVEKLKNPSLKESDIETLGTRLWRELNKSHKESDMETLETEFSQHLLNNKDVLSAACGEMCEVWIYCQNKILEPVWDWVFLEKKKAFWGDKFSIVRLPKNSNFEIERSESQINSVAILLDKTCDYAISDMECLSNLCQHPISDYNLGSLQNEYMGPVDYMHIAGDIKKIKENYDDIIEAVKIAASLSKELFIFYNIWNDEKQHSMHNIQLEVVDSIPAKTRIYTSFDVSKEFATLFAKCFYDCVVEENDVAKAIKKAREEIKNGYLFSTTNGELERDLNDRNIQEGSKEIFRHQKIELSGSVTIAEENGIWMLSDRKNEKTYCIKKKGGKLTIYETDRNLGFNRFWRFAYVLDGNPFTAATWVRS